MVEDAGSERQRSDTERLVGCRVPRGQHKRQDAAVCTDAVQEMVKREEVFGLEDVQEEHADVLAGFGDDGRARAWQDQREVCRGVEAS